ncbi:MAG: response regulator [Anaerolineae bacterium]|nr:response regulator [Anaerolineae bacterium]
MAVILIVDDDQSMRDLISALLGSTYQVVTATDATEALSQAYLARPDLVLLDLNLRRHHDGLEVCRALRRESDPALARVPIVIITGYDDQKTESAALSAGANSYLTKPISGSDLRTLVSRLLARKG